VVQVESALRSIVTGQAQIEEAQMKIHCVRLLLVLLIIAPLTSHCTPPPPDEFDEISLEQIKSTSLSSDKINGSLSELNRIPDGTILVYKTNEGRYGKLQIRDYGYNLTLRWKTYNSDGSVHSSGSSLVIRGTYLCDLDLGEEIDLKEESGVPSDFRWAQDTPEERYLITMNGAEFGIFKSVSLTTIAFDKKNMSDTLIPIVFDTEKGFDVRVSSGAGAGQILFPETVKDLSEIEDIYLEFKDGEVIKASAKKGEELLGEILKIENAKRIGEFAIGTNYGITNFTKNMLFDEKIGGTLHCALGLGFEDTGSTNKSPIHWDMLKDMKIPGSKIIADGKVIYEEGKWKINQS